MTTRRCPLSVAAQTFPATIAIIDEREEVSYFELDRQVSRLVSQLQDHGVAASDRVVVQAENSVALVRMLWATLRLKATACFVNPRWPQAAVDDASDVINADFRIELSQFEDRNDDAGRIFVPTVDDDGVATVVFSSGSTGRPKAVALSLAAHLANAAGANQCLPLNESDRWLLALPLCHVAGFGVVFRCVLAGATVVIPAKQMELGTTVADHAVTHVSVVPVQLQEWLKTHDMCPSTLKAILLGGSHWSETAIHRAVAAGWPIYTTYGLSEMASQVCTSAPSGPGVGTAGPVLRDRELKIDATGEILVRGKTLFLGYMTQSGLDRPLDADGWFHTRDLGVLDENRCLTVLGRMDSMFVSGGENIYPEEIERELLKFDEIDQAVVVSVADERYGRRPVAFVQSNRFQPDCWRASLRETLPGYKVPDRFLVLPDSQGERMKVDRGYLEMLANRPSDS